MLPPATARRDALRHLLVHAPQGMACFDAEQRLVWANPSFASVLGCTVEELLGESLASVERRLAPRLSRHADSGGPLAQCFQGPESNTSLILHFVDGSEQLLRSHGDARGALNLYLTDLAPLRAQERRHSEFLSVAAHELRNPVASLFGFAQLLRSRKLKPEGFEEVTEILCRQADGLSHLVEELLDLARIDAKRGQDFNLQAVSLNALIDEARDALPAGLQPGRIHARIAASADRLWVDRGKALRVLINVLSNALKYSPASTPVELSAQRCGHSKNMAEILVNDHGIGMSAEQQSRIFERFYRADPSGPIPGTGLGMSLVHDIVTLLGGSVSIKSALGQGCSVTLCLPLAAQSPQNQTHGRDSRHSRCDASSITRGSPGHLGEKQGL